MVLINDKKYACESCVKGHRASSCMHTDRPLFEIKRKGRPVTQCEHCRALRSTKQLHVKCECSSKGSGSSAPASGSATPDGSKKGLSGKPAFPNGLKDVHGHVDAADALTSLMAGPSKVADKTPMALGALLNPCRCQTGGKCGCCVRPPAAASSGTSTPDSSSGAASAKGGNTPPLRIATPGATDAVPGIQSTQARRLEHIHPAHTSPHVHKTRLFSPYTPKSRPASRAQPWSPLSPPPRGDSEPDLLSLELPVIRSVSSDNRQVTLPSLSFPLSEPLDLQGCTCDDLLCRCPGCAIHSAGRPATVDPLILHAPTPARAPKTTLQVPPIACPSSCNSCFDCSQHFVAPKSTESMLALITLAAASMPHPNAIALQENLDLVDSLGRLDVPDDPQYPADGREPPSKDENPEELLFLPTKECCNGRCQCPIGDCSCDASCCGCCVSCDCVKPKTEAGESKPDLSSCCGGDQGGNPLAAISLEPPDTADAGRSDRLTGSLLDEAEAVQAVVGGDEATAGVDPVVPVPEGSPWVTGAEEPLFTMGPDDVALLNDLLRQVNSEA